MRLEIKKDYCVNCKRDTEYTLYKDVYHTVIKEKEYDFMITTAKCNECGDEMDIPELWDLNAKEINDQYREIEGLVKIEEIEKLMDIYNIGKAPLSLALGFGEITITRYLQGQYPSKKYSEVIRKALNSPKYMLKKLNDNKDKIGETAYKKSIKAARELIDLIDISEDMLATISYIFKRVDEITPLALQKILYYIQGLHMIICNEPMFEEDCMAWMHGPVYVDIYHMFKSFRYNPIDDNRFVILKNRFKKLNDEKMHVIDLVINTFGNYSGKILEKITHEEEPWKNARRGYETMEVSNVKISKEDIKKYFIKINEKYDLNSEDEINKYIRNTYRNAERKNILL